ncbi:MAG: hypothetical protein ACE5GS_02790 [Kiloniellaceae bacterium]
MPARRFLRLAVILTPLWLPPLTAPPAAGQALGVDQPREYADCMALARARPGDALDRALAWDALGGGEPAKHCAAVALIGLGRYEAAARRLERLAQDMVAATRGLRAGVLAQSAQAWLMAGEAARAVAAQSAALTLDPDNVELLIDRSIALATAGSYWMALDDLNGALDLAPERADILILRASAFRYLDALDLAGDDIERALRLDPDNPDGLLERGILRRLAGDAARAREDWLRVLEIADGAPAADAARANLEKLDVNVE